MILAPSGVFTLSRVAEQKNDERMKKRIENLATIVEKKASSHKIIFINQTPLPVPLSVACPAQWKEMLSGRSLGRGG